MYHQMASKIGILGSSAILLLSLETCSLWNLLRELYTPLTRTAIVYCDSMSVVYMSKFWSNIKELSKLKLIFVFVIKWYRVRFVFFMSLKVPNARTVYQRIPSQIFIDFRPSSIFNSRLNCGVYWCAYICIIDSIGSTYLAHLL